PSGIFPAEFGESVGRPTRHLSQRYPGRRTFGRRTARSLYHNRHPLRIWGGSTQLRLERSLRPTGSNRVPEPRKTPSSKAVLECHHQGDLCVSINVLATVATREHEIPLSAQVSNFACVRHFKYRPPYPSGLWQREGR